MTLFALVLTGCMLEVEGASGPIEETAEEPVLEAFAIEAEALEVAEAEEPTEPEGAPFGIRDRASVPPAHLAVVRSDDWDLVYGGDHLWVRRSWEGEDWREIWLDGAPEGAELLTYSDDAFGSMNLQLVAVSYPIAWLFYLGYENEPATSERVEIEMVAPFGTRPEEALAESRVLRRMKACPRSERPCIAFGAPEDLAAAIDPLFPPHGISFAPVETSPPLESGEVEILPSDERIGFRDGPEDESGVPYEATVVFRHGGRDHVAFALPYHVVEASNTGVEVLEDRILVWAWAPDSVTLAFSFHDRATGERIGEPVTVAGSFYYAEAIDCGHVFTSTRPMPVLTPDGPRVTVFTGANPMMLLDTEGGYLRDVELAWDDLPYSGEDETLPPYFELRADDRLY